MNDDFRIIGDDEPAIRRLCRRVGESLGFICSEAEKRRGRARPAGNRRP